MNKRIVYFRTGQSDTPAANNTLEPYVKLSDVRELIDAVLHLCDAVDNDTGDDHDYFTISGRSKAVRQITTQYR